MIVTSENPLPATTNCSFPSKFSSFAAYKIEMLQFLPCKWLSINSEPNENVSSLRCENSHCFSKGRLYGTQGLYKVFTLCAALSRPIPKHFYILLLKIMLTSEINLKTTLCEVRFKIFHLRNEKQLLFCFGFFNKSYIWFEKPTWNAIFVCLGDVNSTTTLAPVFWLISRSCVRMSLTEASDFNSNFCATHASLGEPVLYSNYHSSFYRQSLQTWINGIRYSFNHIL